MSRFAVLLFAAAWPQLDAFLLPIVAPDRQLSRARHQHHRSTEIICASDDPEEVKVKVTIKKPPSKDGGPPASPITLAIESTFVQAAGGMNGANYEFGLLEFIRAAREAFDKGIMVPALNLELSMCKQYTAGRPLQSDEIELRTVWLSLVYLTFERVGYKSESADTFPGQSVAADLRQKFYTFTVSRILRSHLVPTGSHPCIPLSLARRSLTPTLTAASTTSSMRRSRATTWTS